MKHDAVLEIREWDGVTPKHEREFYKPEHGSIGRGPGLAIAQASRYKLEIPQSLRDRMAAYDANPDPNAKPHRGRYRTRPPARWLSFRFWLATKLFRLAYGIDKLAERVSPYLTLRGCDR